MICDHEEQFDFRAWVRRYAGPLPDRFWLGAECVGIEWTKTAFGGRRPWALCPSCERRCAILYKKPGSVLWGCRVCMDGRYRSEHRSPDQRRRHKAFKIRRRLGQTDHNTVKPFPEKPKGMHWRTYEAIREEALRREWEIRRKDLAAIYGRS